MKRLLAGLGILVVLLIISIITLPFWIPADTIKAQVADQVRSATGRELVIRGEAKPTLFPNIGVGVTDVSFANSEWAQEPQMVTVKELVAKVELMPLLSRKIQIAGFRLVEPVIHLEIGPNGVVNWEIGKPAATVGEKTSTGTETTQPSATAATDRGPALTDIKLDNVEIIGGTVTFSDSITNERHTAEDIDIKLSLPGLDAVLIAEGAMKLDGEPVEVGITAETPHSLAENQAGKIEVSFNSAPASFSFNGSVDGGGGVPQIDGALEATIPDLNSPSFAPILQRLEGILPPEFKSLQSARLSGPVKFSSAGAKTDLSGQIVYRAKAIDLKLALESAGDVAGGAPVKLNLSLGGEPLQMTFNGAAAAGLVPVVKGAYSVKVPSPHGLASWATGKAPEPLKDVGAVDLAGEVDFGADAYGLSANGNVSYKGEAIALTANVSGTGRPEQPGATAVKLAANAPRFNLSFDGMAIRRVTDKPKEPAFEISGPFSFATASIPELAAWGGAELGPSGDVLGAADIKANLAFQRNSIGLTQLDAKLGDTAAKGRLFARISEPLRIRGKLDIAALDLNRYLPKGTAGGGGGATTTPAAPKGSGWSKEPIDFSALHGPDVDVSLSVNNLLYEKLKLDQAAIKLLLKDGALTLDLNELRLYGGSGKGTVRVNPAGSGASISNTFSLNGLQIRPFLTDAADFSRIAGTGNFQINTQTAGSSQHDFMNAMNADGSILFSDGAVHGVNVAAFVRKATTLWTDKGAGEEQKTDFVELSGSFTINDGVLTNNDLQLAGPLVRIEGAGTVNLGAQTLNYRVTPKAVGSLEGQGAEIVPAGLTLFPFDIVGPWSSPSFKPDLGGALGNALKDPGALLEGAKGLIKGEGLKNIEDSAKALLEGGDGGGVEGVIKGVLGGDEPGGGSAGGLVELLGGAKPETGQSGSGSSLIEGCWVVQIPHLLWRQHQKQFPHPLRSPNQNCPIREAC